MPRWIKIVVVFIDISLLAWLYLSSNNTQERVKTLNAALKSGQFPILSAYEQRSIDSIVPAIVQTAHLQEKAKINQPVDLDNNFQHSLYFIVSSPSVSSITHCDKGNAVYDAALRTVFIDISLLRSSEWIGYDPGTGFEITESDVPFLQIYTSFVLFHEIGHHVLQGKSAGFFDFDATRENTAFRKQEAEADAFAYHYFSAYLASSPTVLQRARDASDLHIENPNDSDQMAMALLDMGRDMVLSMQYGLSPFSPFYSDAAHPTFLDRTKGILDQIVAIKAVHPEVIARTKLLKSAIETFQSIAQNMAVTEASLTDPILDIGYANDSIRIITTKCNGFYEIPLSVLKKSSPGNLQQYTLSANTFHPTKPVFDSSTQINLLSLTSGPTLCLVRGENTLYSIERSGMNPLPPHPFRNAFDPPCHVLLDNQPVSTFVITSGSRLYSANLTQTDSANSRLLENQLEKKFHIDSVYINDLDIFENDDYIGAPFTFPSRDGKKLGLLILDKETLNIQKSILFRLPTHFFDNNRYGKEFNDGENVLLFSASKEDDFPAYITTVTKTGDHNTGWQLWQLSDTAWPKQLKSFDFMASKTGNQKALDLMDPYLFKQRLANSGKDKFLINWSEDAVYLLDLSNLSLTTAFYPGDETNQMRTGADHSMIFFIPGTRRFYLEHL
jgi:hypothetical protein